MRLNSWGWRLTASGCSYSLLGILALCRSTITTYHCLVYLFIQETKIKGPFCVSHDGRLTGNKADKVTYIHDYKSGQDNARCYERVQWGAHCLLQVLGRPSHGLDETWHLQGEREVELECCEQDRVHTCPTSLLYTVRVMYCGIIWYNNCRNCCGIYCGCCILW